LSVIEEQEASRDFVRERSWSIFMDPHGLWGGFGAVGMEWIYASASFRL